MERTYGALYDRLTSSALDEIDARLSRPGSIVDFGAGCGRLTLPLAAAGHRVSAIEPSAAMRRELTARLTSLGADAAGRVHVVGCRMEDFTGPGHDLALCVFTVLAYLLDEVELHDGLRAAHSALRPGGLFLLDVPSEGLFQGFDHDDATMIRHVEIEPRGGSRYAYLEVTTLRTPEGIVRFEDSFELRRWSVAEVVTALEAAGFHEKADVSDRFAGLGAEYLLMERD
jgi:SAM-dependent methyltransferase